MQTEQIAKVCHEANRAYCQCLGDNSQVPWKEAPNWQRVSAVSGVINALAGASPEASHENWLKDKLLDGWKYGEKKDSEARTHPCLVPYADLPEEQKLKDTLFVAVVNTLKDRR